MKRLLASISIIVLISTAFISGYFRYDHLNVYAAEWSPIASGEEVDAFIAYCKSRNLNIESSIIDNDAAGRSVIAVTNSVYNELCSQLGLNPTELQATIKKNTSSEGVTNWFFSDIGMINRLFNAYLQKYDLAVGDSVEDKSLYNGYIVGNSLVYVFNSNMNPSSSNHIDIGSYSPMRSNCLIQEGVPIDTYKSYLFTPTSLNETFTSSKTYTILNNNYVVNYKGYVLELYHSNNALTPVIELSSPAIMIYRNNDPNGTNRFFVQSDFGLCYFQKDSSLRFCIIQNCVSGRWVGRIACYPLSSLDKSSMQPANVYITTNNTTINNNNYEGDTIINNNGKVSQPDKPIPDPNDDHTTVTNPVQPDSPDSDSNLTFPLIDLDIPSIDWSLGDLSDKFPFSIPFDLIAFFTVLNAEPETPELQGQIDLGIVTWDIDWNLSDFDNIAKILRNLEFIGFCIGLILITRSLIKG